MSSEKQLKGQMSIFDFPEILPENNSIISKTEPVEIFPMPKPTETAEALNSAKSFQKKLEFRTPCNRMCDVEWCSKICFERRGYIWDKCKREWVKDIHGKCLISSTVECDYKPKQTTRNDSEHLSIDSLNPCDCGYSGRMAVRYTGCGIPNNGYMNGTPTFDKYLFTVYCPECFRMATAGGTLEGWWSNKTDPQKALKDWNTNKRLPCSPPALIERLKRESLEMDKTLERFPEFLDSEGE